MHFKLLLALAALHVLNVTGQGGPSTVITVFFADRIVQLDQERSTVPYGLTNTPVIRLDAGAVPSRLFRRNTLVARDEQAAEVSFNIPNDVLPGLSPSTPGGGIPSTISTCYLNFTTYGANGQGGHWSAVLPNGDNIINIYTLVTPVSVQNDTWASHARIGHLVGSMDLQSTGDGDEGVNTSISSAAVPCSPGRNEFLLKPSGAQSFSFSWTESSTPENGLQYIIRTDHRPVPVPLGPGPVIIPSGTVIA